MRKFSLVLIFVRSVVEYYGRVIGRRRVGRVCIAAGIVSREFLGASVSRDVKGRRLGRRYSNCGRFFVCLFGKSIGGCVGRKWKGRVERFSIRDCLLSGGGFFGRAMEDERRNI